MRLKYSNCDGVSSAVVTALVPVVLVSLFTEPAMELKARSRTLFGTQKVERSLRDVPDAEHAAVAEPPGRGVCGRVRRAVLVVSYYQHDRRAPITTWGGGMLCERRRDIL
jgi:hypothetical protein